MAPKADNYDAEATSKREIPNDQVMEDAGKVHLGKSCRTRRVGIPSVLSAIVSLTAL